MKKGFTLAELIGVIVILGAIALIMIPVVVKNIKQGNEELYNSQIESIKQSLQLWTSEYQKPKTNEVIYLSLSQLKESGLVNVDIKDPRTGELFPNDMVLKIVNTNGIISYDISTDGTNKEDYTKLSKFKLIGDTLVYVELGKTYIDEGVQDKDGNKLNVTPVVSSDNVSSIYRYTYNNNTIYRTVIFKDTKGPEISFNNLTIRLSQIDTYDFLSDITVRDNSNEQVTTEVVKNFNYSVGTFTVKYIAKDSSGNETIKYRNVTIIAD